MMSDETRFVLFIRLWIYLIEKLLPRRTYM